MKKNIAIPIDVLCSGDAEALAKFGPQDLSLEEIAQRNADDIAQAETLAAAAATQYRRNRAAAYPPIGDQLDELWSVLAALADKKDVPETALAMLRDIQAVKDKFPKP